MVARSQRIRRFLTVGLAVAAVAAALVPAVTPVPFSPVAAPDCINGVWPLNPYVVNCNLPPRGNRVLGAAPDAGAIIACRHNPQCLSLYVNGGMGWYPGATLVPGYHP